MDTDKPAHDAAPLADWIGRKQRLIDDIALAPAHALWATLNAGDPAPAAGQPLPWLWHWMYFNPAAPRHTLGQDGHPTTGVLRPPIRQPRRMWAGGSLDFHQPLHIGDEVLRDSRIVAINEKQGRTGALCFLTLRHQLTGPRGLAIDERHDIVYRELHQPGALPSPDVPAPADEQFSRRLTPDPVLLFRYSALTFNGHRIHYDAPYATQTEGYAGLVVHGPLIATLLADLLARQQPGLRLRQFSYKGIGPLFADHELVLCGRQTGEREFALWARNAQGRLGMQATALID